MSELVAVDIGGTHARFALATTQGGRVAHLGTPVTLRTSDFPDLPSAWQEFGRRTGKALPRAAGIAVAAPVQSETLKLTNNSWVIRPAALAGQLGLDRVLLVNDFGAVGHAVAQLGADQFRHLYGEPGELPAEGSISIVGPGTGLGAAQVLRRDGVYHVIETEGGHVNFAPLDAIDDALLVHLRMRYGRVSAERVASGKGLANVYEALCAQAGRPVQFADEKSLWAAATAAQDPLATAALERFFLALGSVAGDIALAQGAVAVVLAGGLGLRLADALQRSGFHRCFTDKGRHAERMARLPIKLITHPEPGLFGAAAALTRLG